jgi:general secretion pathway protein N
MSRRLSGVSDLNHIMTKNPSFSRHPAARPPWRLAWAGSLLGFMLALLLFAPATWVAAAVYQTSAGQVQLVDARGTVWTGSARLLLTGGLGSLGSAALPGRLDWQLRPGWLHVKLALSADCCTDAPIQARLGWRWSGPTLQLTDGASHWPAAVLTGLGTPWNTLQAEGTLRLVTQGLSLAWTEGRLALAGRTELTAMDMSSRLSTLKPMGSYRVTLTGGPQAGLELATLDGSLKLSGSGHWVGSRLKFQGVASADPEHEAALANLLNIIGRRNGARSIITLG